jgi:hypothetical protein
MSRIRIMVAVCGADNALIESPTLTAEHLSSLHRIVSYDATTQYTPADKHLRFAGVERQVEVVVQNFLGLPFLLACTKRVAILQQRLAEKLRVAGGIRVLELPLSVPELIEAAWWPLMRVGRLIPVSRSVAVGALGHRIGARADSAGSTSRVGVARELTPR